MDKEMDQSLDTQNAQAVNTPSAQMRASRRRFTRGAVLGGAVVLSLGNRAAWSQASPVCLSANTLASAANYATGVHASMSPTNQADIIEYRQRAAAGGVPYDDPDNVGGKCVLPPPG